MFLRRIIKNIAVCLSVLTAVSLCSYSALASVGKDSASCSLTVYFGSDGTGFQQVRFKLYRVADVSNELDFTLEEDFEAYPIDLDDPGSSEWRALAQTLAGYAARDSLTADFIEHTDEDGNVFFKNLSAGLYLVLGNRCEAGDYIFTPEPFLVCLPGIDPESGGRMYDVIAACKFDTEYVSENEIVSLSVRKIWQDAGNEVRRPSQIQIQLLRDSSIYDTVVLGEENDWQYAWNGLDGDFLWQVTEKDIPEDYTVSISRENSEFIITNSCSEKDDGSKLPQTGMLWWPVPVLTLCGMILFLTGWARRHCHDK